MLAKRFPFGRQAVALGLGFALVTSPLVSHAQAKPPAEPSASRAAQIEEAKNHYDRGLRLYDEGNFEGARVEFEKAYQLAPSYKILYNLGLVHKQQADYVSALRSFEAYLSEGGSGVIEVRRVEIAREMQELKSRIGRVSVSVNVEGAEVFIDDVSVGKTPLREPLLVNPGRRKVSATARGYLPATRVVQVAGSDTASLALSLEKSGKETVVVVRQRRVPWVGWGTTAALAAGAGIAGYFTLRASSNLDDTKARYYGDSSQAVDRLDSLNSQTRTLSIVSDALAGGALIVGGISLYYTIKWGNETDESPGRAREPKASQSPSLRVGVQPGGVSLAGAF
jgi:PEGA domain-containing protein/tetratricopeptide repeat protein